MATHVNARTGPRIVFVSQLGAGGSSWQTVIDRLPDPVAAFTYDRPGTGDAPPRPAPNPPLPHSAMAAELLSLLDAHQVTDPAIVVGHSIGGLIARQFAARYPHRVAGVVLVDSSIPPTHLHPEIRPIIDGDDPDATEFDVVRGHVEALEAVLPQVPALVVSRTPGSWDGVNSPPRHAVEDLWRAYQRRYARELGCPLLVADDCGHQLPREAPALVAYAVQAVHRAVVAGQAIQVDVGLLAEAGGHLDQ